MLSLNRTQNSGFSDKIEREKTKQNENFEIAMI